MRFNEYQHMARLVVGLLALSRDFPFCQCTATHSRVLRLLHELGLDLSATCDAEEFGSAIFYSVYLGRVECLEVNYTFFFSVVAEYDVTKWATKEEDESVRRPH